MIKITGTGRLVNNVEVVELEKSLILKFTLASNNQDDTTEYLDCTLLTGKESKIKDQLNKGLLVSFVGNYFTEKWTNKEGQKDSKVLCRIDDLNFEAFPQKKAE